MWNEERCVQVKNKLNQKGCHLWTLTWKVVTQKSVKSPLETVQKRGRHFQKIQTSRSNNRRALPPIKLLIIVFYKEEFGRLQRQSVHFFQGNVFSSSALTDGVASMQRLQESLFVVLKRTVASLAGRHIQTKLVAASSSSSFWIQLPGVLKQQGTEIDQLFDWRLLCFGSRSGVTLLGWDRKKRLLSIFPSVPDLGSFKNDLIPPE